MNLFIKISCILVVTTQDINRQALATLTEEFLRRLRYAVGSSDGCIAFTFSSRTRNVAMGTAHLFSRLRTTPHCHVFSGCWRFPCTESLYAIECKCSHHQYLQKPFSTNRPSLNYSTTTNNYEFSRIHER